MSRFWTQKMSLEPQIQIATPPTGTWVQTERAAHERWSILAVENPRAAALLHVIIAKMGRHNALVASQETLSTLTKCSTRTVRRSLQVLKEENWIEIRQVGASGTVNAYIVNDRVAWSGARDGIRYSLFSAAVLVSDNEQPDNADIGMQPPLEHIPSLQPGERQLPTGPGMPPPSQPSLDGLEPDLPATHSDDTAQ